MALHLCPSSAGPAIGPHDYSHWVSSYRLRMESKTMPIKYDPGVAKSFYNFIIIYHILVRSSHSWMIDVLG